MNYESQEKENNISSLTKLYKERKVIVETLANEKDYEECVKLRRKYSDITFRIEANKTRNNDGWKNPKKTYSFNQSDNNKRVSN